MGCQLIQVNQVGHENIAEKKVLQFLKNCPAGYTVYRELQVTNTYLNRLEGYQKKQPDFVVVSPEIGVISIEVKDWNLDRNTYIWEEQYNIRVSNPNGQSWTIKNPVSQMDSYLYALQELLQGIKVFTSSILIFPSVSKAEFLNKLENVEVLKNPQSRFHLDLNRTLFQEHLDKNFNRPAQLLKKIVRNHPKFEPTKENIIDQVNERLLPSTFRIGDFATREQSKNQLKIISEKQQRWIFNLDPKKNYLLDVAGSGKTNALISKAIHLVNQEIDSPPQILLTTYSENLERNIRKIFHQKISNSPRKQKYLDAITICCVPKLLERMVCKILEIPSIQPYRKQSDSSENYEKKLLDDVLDHLDSHPNEFRKFDFVLIDEIQDLSDDFLIVVSYLNKTKQYFLVGDIGQKIFNREFNLKIIGFDPKQADLGKSYKMYRTPKYIGKLATRFILADPISKQDLTSHGYTQRFTPVNENKTLPVVLETPLPEKSTRKRINDLVGSLYTYQDIMVIASRNMTSKIENELDQHSIPVLREEPAKEKDAIVLVNFSNVKGLEREVVIVTGIENLYHRQSAAATFDDSQTQSRKEVFSRRKIYVAITRTIEKLYIYYIDPHNLFISDLLEISSELTNNLQGHQYDL
jgi:hypothetical protein